MFINGIMTNTESWNYLTKKQIKTFEESDSRLFSTLFCSPRSTNRVMYYLETAKIPLRHVLAKRRFLYLWHILSRPDIELIKRVYTIQTIKPVKNDYALMIREEKQKYNIELSDSEIQSMSRGQFKNYVNKQVDTFAFNSLITTARNQSKCQHMLKTINESNMKIQKYLVCDKLTKEEQLLLFSLRSFTFQVKTNFRYLHRDNMICRACLDPQSEESEEHISRTCQQFQKERNGEDLNCEDVFSTLDDQISFIKKFKIIARKWKLLLENETSTI